MSNETAIVSLKEKIDDLNQQAWEVRVTDLPKSLELSQESVKLARSINYPRGLAEGLRSLGFSYVRFSKNDQAAPLLKESLSLFQSLNDLKGQAVIYEYLGIIERNWGNLGASLDLLLKANEIVLQTGPLEVELTCSYQLGVTYKHLGNHENALDYLYKTLSLAKRINYPLMEAYAINIIGSIYFDNGNYNQALDCYQQGLPIRQQSHDKWGEAGSLDNIGFTYLKLNDLDKAKEYCKQSLAICQGTGDKKGEANALLHLAEIYEQAGDVKQAAGFSNESLAIRKDRGDKRGETEVLLFLADLYKNRNDVEDHQIFEWLSGALKIADEIKAQDLLSKAYYNLHEYYQQKGNFKESLVQLEAHFQIEKELHKNSINQKVANLEISHKAEVVSQRNKELTELNEKIEKANEELKIERSLERVRSAAMAMKEPADMLEVCKIISAQLEILDVKKIRNVQTAIFYEEKGVYMNYEYYAKHDKQLITEVDYNNHPVAEKFANQMLKGPNEVFTHGFTGKEVKEWLDYQKTTNVFIDTYLETADSLNYYWYSLGPVALGLSTYVPLNENEIDLFKRFRNVFELAYRRYRDIEKAEAQAREAKIEAALEKVRSRSLAMHHPDELEQVVASLFDRLIELGLSFDGAVIFLFEKEKRNIQLWIATTHLSAPVKIELPYDKEIENNAIIKDLWHAIETGGHILNRSYSGETKNDYFRYVAKYNESKIPESVRQLQIQRDSWTAFFATEKNSIVGFDSWSGQIYSDDDFQILIRFARVFEQAYTRFLDLQKAEAQAREAKIEAALERTRTQSMIMQHSNELDDALRVFHEQVLLLGIDSAFSFLWLPDEKNDRHIFWAAWGEDLPAGEAGKNGSTVFKSKAINYPLDRNEPATAQCLVDWKSNEPVYSYHVPPAAVENYFAVWQELIDGVEHLKPEYFSGGLHYVEAFMKYGCFGVMVATDLTEDEKKILGRFAIEFERTYTRFLDLKKAEAQAREAKIETALEKVRSRTMAMQKSAELGDVATVLFKEMNQLVENLWTCGFVLCEKDRAEDEWWLSTETGFIPAFFLPNTGDRVHENLFTGWKNGEAYRAEQVDGAELEQHYEWLMNIPVAKKVFDDMAAAGFQKPVWQKLHAAYFSKGYLCIITQVPCPEEQIFKRFAQVFDLTYTRFLDLQKAEAQTREAKIETALERVRARALAMQEPEELKDVAQVLRTEMGLLGVEELETCSIYINDESAEKAECWYALKDIRSEEKKLVNDHFALNLNDTWVGRQMLQFYRSPEKKISIIMQGKNRKEWISYCEEHSALLRGYYGEVIPDRTYHLYKFSHGAIGAAAAGDISEESWRMLRRAASVFSLAYSRFKDLTQARTDLIKLKEEKKRAEDALTELQATQKQLIQAEKMASLGELTAGIAHEIQNPLNFVNNFSDVSNELLEEMKTELEKGNAEGAKEIAIDVKENLEKILHHGKRADAIVKGMLQHSRSSSGQKEPTDINVLAEEYLRLAYHGLRAKDKFFNAKFETDLDPSISKINIVPQEIGRVILNLINNSFYAVSEKKKLMGNGYEPAVTVSTKTVKPPLGGLGVIEIMVKDNGIGIPKKALDKIFQPFFTTKPTGQGTGLGLSLSYDIITKGHDGEIKVETKEGEGSAFTISLPMK